jgi:hypothetical protein
LVSKADAREFWVMLPTQLKAAGIKVNLPANHRLDSAMTGEVVTAVSTAREAMDSVTAKIAAAKAKAAAGRPAELKARQAVYNKRAYLKRRAKKLACQQPQESQGGAEPSPLANAA